MGNKGSECDEFEEVTSVITNSEIGGLFFLCKRSYIIEFMRCLLLLLLLLLASRYHSKPSN